MTSSRRTYINGMKERNEQQQMFKEYSKQSSSKMFHSRFLFLSFTEL